LLWRQQQHGLYGCSRSVNMIARPIPYTAFGHNLF
jgi:hypothetical protein